MSDATLTETEKLRIKVPKMFRIATPTRATILEAARIYEDAWTDSGREGALKVAREAAKALTANIDRAIRMYEKQKGQLADD